MYKFKEWFDKKPKDMLSKTTVSKIKNYISKLDKKQYTPKNIDKEKYEDGRYFLFDCYGNLLYVGISDASEKGHGHPQGRNFPEGIVKELRKFYQQDTADSRSAYDPRVIAPLAETYGEILKSKFHADNPDIPIIPVYSSHPSADPEIRKRICMYAVDYNLDNDTKKIPCGLYSELPRRNACNENMRKVSYRLTNLQEKKQAFKKSLPTIFSKEKQIAKRPIIKCHQFDKDSYEWRCKAIKFVKPIK